MTRTSRITRRLAAASSLAAALALSACATTAPDLDQGTRLAASLSGAKEVPEAGAAGGAGSFTAALEEDGELCYQLAASGIETPNAAHIHRGAAGENGPPVVNLAPPRDEGGSDGCTFVDAMLAQEMMANPAGFYVNVHTTPYPGGAVRGQLGAAGGH